MNNVVNLNNYKNEMHCQDKDYILKLCRIRDVVENELTTKSVKENDKFAVSLASGRYAAMNLANFLGEDEAINFFKDCIHTVIKNK